MKINRKKGGKQKKWFVMIMGMLIAVLVSGFIIHTDSQAAKKKKHVIHIEPEYLSWVSGNTDRKSLVLTDDRNFITGDVKFYSEDPELIDITENGRLILNNETQKKSGSTRLAAVYQGKTYFCKFKKVVPYPAKENVLLTLGKKNHNSEKLQMKGIKGADGKDLKCIWYSSKPSVAKVNKNGKVTAKKEGTTTISCSVNSQGKFHCVVKVEKAGVSSLTLDKESLTMKKDDQEKLTATLLPENATNNKLKWESEDTKVATVSEYGRVTAVNPGDTVIWVESEDDFSYRAKCKVHVAFAKEDVELSVKEATLTWTAKSITLTDKTGTLKTEDVHWKVEDPSIVELDEEQKTGYNNEIKPRKNGTTNVIAVVNAPDGNVYEYVCKVKVVADNYGLDGKVYRKNDKGEEQLSVDGIIKVSITNNTKSDVAIFQNEEEEDSKYKPVLSMGGEYIMDYRSCEENTKVFDYNNGGSVACIRIGETKSFYLQVKEEDQQKVKRASYNFRSASFTFYVYDKAGIPHLIKISGANDEGTILENQTEDEIQTSDDLRIWNQ